jgi:neutral ceramidase
LKKLPARKLLVAAVVALLGIPAALLGVASAPTPKSRPETAPAIVAQCRGKGPLTAGASSVPLELPAGVPIGGFARLDYASAGVRDPVGVRALVIRSGDCRVALVSAELLLVPEALEEAVRARLPDVPLDGLVLAATHTHAGPGGFWENAFVERLGTGPFDPALRDGLAHAIGEAVRRAAHDAGPATLRVARGRAEPLARNRAGGKLVDARLAVLRLERPGGAPIGEVALFPAHPTTLGKKNRLISGDWPGRFLSVTSHGVRLFFQGAGGDQSTRLPTDGAVTPESYAAAVSTEVDKLVFGPADPEPALAFARADLRLPAIEPGAVPGFLARPVRNAVHDALPGDAAVAALKLGPVTLAVVPGEPTAEVGAALRREVGNGAEVLSLAGGYCGYVEAAEVMAERRGETRRTYYGPELATRVQRAIAVVASAVRGQAGVGSRPAPPAGAERAASPLKSTPGGAGAAPRAQQRR